jgi:hypothetical protein
MRQCIKYQFQGVKGILSESPCVPGSIPGSTINVKCYPFVNTNLQMNILFRIGFEGRIHLNHTLLCFHLA